ncbi:hypothetical protein [Microcoleus sp. bin38.metabat.b11b12b14.051]|uniref:hypothetical protein n=1 Tax=Microcoleus sp. bin38.metabat.b11b12b14.051 TaxID=2742709 RepID=UPI0025DC4D04|nr:hypothetical protein [Microcoleus sp. bin38.metabat.b11b12b14.051]
MLLLVYQLLLDLAMTFRENNKLGFTSDNPLEKTPICFKGRKGQREALMAIPNWPEKLRDAIDRLLFEKPS